MKKGEISIGLVGDTVFPDKGYIEREDGRVAIKHAIGGQKVEYCITKKRAGEAQGRVLRVLEPSSVEDRKNLCNFAGICGGCLYQSVGYQHQLDIKEEQLKKLLKDEEFIWEGIQASPAVEGYRNKMEFSFGDQEKDGPLCLGLHQKRSFFNILNTEDCRLPHPDMGEILLATRLYFQEQGLGYYHKKRHEGYLRHLLIRRAEKTGEILLSLVHSTQLPAEEEERILSGWRDRLLSLEKEGKLEGSYAGILHTKNDSLADAVINDGTEALYGKDYFYEELLGLNFKITPFSFFQTNTLGAEKLYAKVQEYSSFSENAEEKPVIYDLYSGTGTITQLMSKVAKQAIGVEIVEEAVEAAKENAKENKVENCIFYAGDVLKVLEAGQGATELPYPDFIIVDPPRDGMHKKALEKIISYGVKRLVYVACKPKSLARDLEALQNAGYRVQKLCAVDMFPKTNNCEVVALLEKEES